MNTHHMFIYTITFIGCIINVYSFTINQESLVDNKNAKRVKREEEPYTTEFDNFDIDEVLQSDRLMRSYIKCILDNGPCTKEAKLLKEYIPDALKTDCIKCSEQQIRQGGRVLNVVLQNYREDWDMIVSKYDPDGIFRKKYGYGENEELDNQGDEA